MKNGCKYIAALFPALVMWIGAYAQVTVRAVTDRDSVLIGEPVTLTIEAYLPLGLDVAWPRFDTIPHFSILGRHRVDSIKNIDGKKISQSITIAAFDSGHYRIAPVEVRVATVSYFTDTVSLAIGYAPFDAAEDYRDIRDIIEAGDSSMKAVPWILGAVVVISGLLILWLTRKKKNRPAQVSSAVPLLTPFEEAMASLRALDRQGVGTGQEKIFYSLLNDVLRTYLFRKYTISTAERTNGELIAQLASLGLNQEEFSRVAQALRIMDFVKFARYVPATNENGLNLEIVRSSIKKLENRTASVV